MMGIDTFITCFDNDVREVVFRHNCHQMIGSGGPFLSRADVLEHPQGGD